MKHTGKILGFLIFTVILSVLLITSAFALVPENREQSPASVSGFGETLGSAARDAGRAVGDVIDGIGRAARDAGNAAGVMDGDDGVNNGIIEDDNASNGVIDNDNVNGSPENSAAGTLNGTASGSPAGSASGNGSTSAAGSSAAGGSVSAERGGMNWGLWIVLLIAAAVALLLLFMPKRSTEA